MRTNLLLRLRAALWCAGVAIIPAAGYSLYMSQDGYVNLGTLLLVLLVLPVISAAISGFWIGWRLIDPAAPHDTWGAVRLGLAVALLAYAILVALFLLVISAQRIGYALQSGGALDLVRGLPSALLGYVSLVGVVLLQTGWFTLPIACVAAYWLSRRYRSKGLSRALPRA